MVMVQADDVCEPDELVGVEPPSIDGDGTQSSVVAVTRVQEGTLFCIDTGSRCAKLWSCASYHPSLEGIDGEQCLGLTGMNIHSGQSGCIQHTQMFQVIKRSNDEAIKCMFFFIFFIRYTFLFDIPRAQSQEVASVRGDVVD
jgi:hypothetical protein